jgi:hypothetical protein
LSVLPNTSIESHQNVAPGMYSRSRRY